MENKVNCGVHDKFIIKKENSKTDKSAVKPHLPQELIYEIILLLPLKSLARFKCVSKSFRAIIDSQDFMNMRLNASSKNKIHPKLIFQEKLTDLRTPKSKCTGFQVCDIDGGLEEKIIFEKPGRKVLVPYSYCKGLFLLSDALSKLVLWNPSTKQYKSLPACPVDVPTDGDYGTFRMGLGYDAAADDYKVLLIDGISSPFQGYGHARPCEAWIFGLRSNLWRRIQDSFPCVQHCWSDSAYFSHGDIHWLCSPPIPWHWEDRHVHLHEQKIVAFDVTKEIFSQVKQPVYTIEGYLTGLHVLDGCLCISFFSYTIPEEAHLYVRKKDGDDFTWSKLCSVTAEMCYVTAQKPLFFNLRYFKSVKVVGYSKEGDKIILNFGVKFVVLYDVKKKIFDKIEFRGGYASGLSPRMFSESLVSLGLGTTSTKESSWRM